MKFNHGKELQTAFSFGQIKTDCTFNHVVVTQCALSAVRGLTHFSRSMLLCSILFASPSMNITFLVFFHHIELCFLPT